MRFCRRAEGLKSYRTCFAKARKDKWTTWEVYEAGALMEYHSNKATDVANRIFEKGLEFFGSEVEFVLRYLGFLISINDENSRVGFFLYGRSLLNSCFSYRCPSVVRARRR